MRGYLEEPPYQGYRIFGPDGTLLSLVSQKRFQYFLDRGLAEKIDEKGLRLFSPPKGKRFSPYLLREIANQCVRCGKTEKLTKHHVVPYSFRRWFPEEKKRKNHYDILLLCIECHDFYEPSSQEFREKLAQEVGLSSYGKIPIKGNGRVRSVANALLNYRTQMPFSVYRERLNEVYAWLGRNQVTEAELKQLAKIPLYETQKEKPEQTIINQLGVETVTRRWREHFLTILKPLFLPSGWTVEGESGTMPVC